MSRPGLIPPPDGARRRRQGRVPHYHVFTGVRTVSYFDLMTRENGEISAGQGRIIRAFTVGSSRRKQLRPRDALRHAYMNIHEQNEIVLKKQCLVVVVPRIVLLLS